MQLVTNTYGSYESGEFPNPDYRGIGKSVSRGFGTIKKINNAVSN